MGTEWQCPRRGEVPPMFKLERDDTWREDNTCSFCGSLNPDEFMRRLEAKDVRLDPTDKSYKVYVNNEGGASFKQSYRKCPPGCTAGPEACPHWVVEDTQMVKFYFQHLSREQKGRFIELVNDGMVRLSYPGRFYVAPFFMKRIDS